MDEGARLVVPYDIEEERRGGWSMGGREDGGSRIRLGEVEEGTHATAKLVHDSVLGMEGFRLGGGMCRIRIYRGDEPSDAPTLGTRHRVVFPVDPEAASVLHSAE